MAIFVDRTDERNMIMFSFAKDYYTGVRPHELDEFRRFAAQTVLGLELTDQDLVDMTEYRTIADNREFRASHPYLYRRYGFGYGPGPTSFEYFGEIGRDSVSIELAYRSVKDPRELILSYTVPRGQLDQIPAGPFRQIP